MAPLLALLLAAPPTLERAQSLAKSGAWDELYLAFGATKAGDLPKAQVKPVALLLGQGCQALLSSDAAIAQGLGEKALELAGPGAGAEAALCTSAAALANEQRGAAEAVLGQGLARFPKDGRFGLELARLHLLENDPQAALGVLAKLPKKGAHAKQAESLKASAQAALSQNKSGQAEARAQSAELLRRQEAAGRGEAPPPERRGATPAAERTPGSLSYESGVDGEGRRTRANAHFRFRYFNGQRDFGERADYEGRVQAALEAARAASKGVLGVTRETPTDVVLYSREEFALHHGPQAAQSVAGFYSQNAIRMNDSATIDERTRATLVHEYTHAVIDEVASFRSSAIPVWLHEGLAEWTEWRSQGHDGPPHGLKKALQGAAKAGQLPSLGSMSQGMLVGQANPALRYALSGVVVGQLVKSLGVGGVISLVERTGKGQAFEKVLTDATGAGTQALDEHVARSLAP